MANEQQFSPIREALTERLKNLQSPQGQLGSALGQIGDNAVSLISPNHKYRDVGDANIEDQMSAYEMLVKAQQMGHPDAKVISNAMETFLGKDGLPDEKAALAEWLYANDAELTPENVMTMSARGIRELGLGQQRKAQSELGRRYADIRAGLIPEDADVSLRSTTGGAGGVTKAPTGYRWVDDGRTELEPIPGGPGTDIPSELAARVALSDTFLGDIGTLEKDLTKLSGAEGTIGQIFRTGDQGDVLRRFKSGTDALRRMLTGAGMNLSEAEEYVRRYEPELTDTVPTMTKKLKQLSKELTNIRATALRGRASRSEVEKYQDDGLQEGSGTIQMQSPDGTVYEVDAAEADEAEANGWTRAE